MLPPSMDYAVGKGRQYELEQKAAKNRLLEEALDTIGPQRQGLFARIVAILAIRRTIRTVELPKARAAQQRERLAG